MKCTRVCVGMAWNGMEGMGKGCCVSRTVLRCALLTMELARKEQVDPGSAGVSRLNECMDGWMNGGSVRGAMDSPGACVPSPHQQLDRYPEGPGGLRTERTLSRPSLRAGGPPS